MTAASAAEDVITVTNLTNCQDPGSFGAALAAANASTNPDGVKIEFAAALAGTGPITHPGFVCKMWDQPIGVGNELAGPLGARYLIDADVPVTIDFTNLDGIDTNVDANFAGIYVHSDNVTLSNLSKLKAGSAGLAIDGTNVSVDNVTFADTDSAIAEVGVALLNGATDVSITNSTFASQWWSSILIDGSQANPTTVTNITIDNITSRGVESAYGHIDIEDGAIVNGLSVTNSDFGSADEIFTTPTFYFNPAVTTTGLTFSNNTMTQGTGPERNVVMFEGGAGNTSSFTDTVFDGNTFTGISRLQPLSRIIGANSGTWTGLEYTNNTSSFTRGILMNGTVTDALFDGNTFTEVREPNGGALSLGLSGASVMTDVTVSNNFFDTPWSDDGIRVQGSNAENVVIENNKIHDFHADISKSAIALIAPGTNNVVRDNELIQHLERGDNVDLPANMANHWAVYVWGFAGEATPDATVGWSVLNNHIDGFGGNPNIPTQAPITDNAVGKTLITGNTFGPNTRGSFDPETENLGYWFMWNNGALANNRVQTFRAESVIYNGSTATFTATQPAPEVGNNPAVGPVTLHVYWTADDHAEEYLGSVDNVTAGQKVTVDTAHTSGYLRVQTVDANGYTSQYSSIDQNIVVAPAAPVVTTTTETTAEGTGEPAATVEVRDADGNVVGTAVVAADGTWTVDGLECGTDYTVVQVVDGVDSAETPFTTADCVVAPTAPVVTDTTETAANGTGTPEATVEVRDADGNVVGTAVVAADGTWTVDGLECGTDYTVVQVVDGVDSAETPFTTADCVVAPTAPVVTDTTETAANGTGTPEATVEVRDADGNVVGTVVVAADGTWTVDGLECGTDYTVVQVVDGVDSAETPFTTADCVVAPTAPVVTDTTETAANGTGTPEATVEVRDADGNVVGTVVVAADGTWTVSGLECGTDYTVVQIVDGVDSAETPFTTADCVVTPAAPAVTSTTETAVAGTGTPAATVEVRDADGKVVGTVVVAADGTWTVSGLECGTDYTAVQIVDGVDSAETPFTTADCVEPGVPGAPLVTTITDDGAEGVGLPEAVIEVRDGDGKVVATTTAGADGTWSVDGLECGTTYAVVQIVDGVESAPTTITTADCAVVPSVPTAPTVTEVTKETVSGKGEATATVTIRDKDGKKVASGTVDEKGAWSINISKLACNTDYSATQTRDGIEGPATKFRTAACGATLPTTGAPDVSGLVGGAALLLLLGAGALMIIRRQGSKA
ncbi:Ig-like domain-containing protein [Microbacterium gorillae]|uniref:Ig-like domain-containing protein n=1 Tax=Microbacterium gorillae TaxID=1231063 RepID=UPI003D962AFC